MFSLAIQSFGREEEYKRAILTILSFFCWYPYDPQNVKVILFTDHPEYFEDYLKGLSIEYVLLTPKKIKEMRGQIDFLHRMKIALIEEAFTRSNGSLLYADSDTFFTADATPFVQQVCPDKSMMHEFEYDFEYLRHWKLPAGKAFIDFLKLIESQSFKLSNGGAITVTPNHTSWNAGVMIFHSSHARFIPDVYALTEQFYPFSKNHASEQYAFSIILQEKTNLSSCEGMIYHYWNRVKKQIIDQFLERRFTLAWASLTLNEKLTQVKKWTMHLPNHFENHVWMTRDLALQALYDGRLREAYGWTLKSIWKAPFTSVEFMKNVIYYSRQHFKIKHEETSH